MKTLIWLDDPQVAVSVMNTLVFRQNHKAIKCNVWEEVEVNLSLSGHEFQAVFVDTQKRADRVRGIPYHGQIQVVPAPITEPKGIDGKLYKATARVGRWLAEYGVRHVPLVLAHFADKILSTQRNVYALIYVGRAGHLAYNTATMITALARQGVMVDQIVPILSDPEPADTYLLDLYLRAFDNKPTKRRPKRLQLPLFRRSSSFVDSWSYTDVFEPIQRYGSEYGVDLMHLTTEQEDSMASRALERHGIIGRDNGHSYMVFHARDAEYLNQHQPGHDWNYHTFRDCHIEEYLEAAIYMWEEHHVRPVRVGIHTNQSISQDYKDQGIIDYAQDIDESDMVGIHLIVNAKFLLGSNCGVTQVAQVLKTPVAVANWAQLELLTTFREGDMCIPKGIYSTDMERPLSLTEILSNGIGRYTKIEQFQKHNLVLLDNTAVQITDLAQEMNARLDGTWTPEPDDDELQEQFRAIINNDNYLCKDTAARCGAKFLRENEWARL